MGDGLDRGAQMTPRPSDVRIPLTYEEKIELYAAAERDLQAFAAWARRVLLREARKEKKVQP